MMKYCEKCGSRMIEDLIDYNTEVLGVPITIDKVEGYQCSKCDHTTIEEKFRNRLQGRILEKKLEIQKEKIQKYKPILVNNIRKIRLERNISQKKLGEAIGMAEQRYGSIERNDNTPVIATANLIAVALGVSIDDLYETQYVTNAFYNKIKNLTAKIEPLPNGGFEYEFKEISELKKINDLYDQQEEKLKGLQKKFSELRDGNKQYKEYRYATNKLKKIAQGKANENDEEKRDDYIELQQILGKSGLVIPVLDIINKVEVETQKRNELLKKKREIEDKKKCVLRISQAVEREIFDALVNLYPNEYNTME